ncbi:hypothetical protein [Peptostreptococcus stomatis]|uniref:hypothetical protein n=1 Tax=Peptostreptococcus stomatis TaxID=341694 RepID=UPI003FA03B6C
MKNISVCIKKYRIKKDGIKVEYYRKDRGSFDKYGPKKHSAYLATEFIFTLIIFSIALYIFSYFVMNIAYMENKLDDREELDYLLGQAMVEERSYIKDYKGDYEDLDLVFSKNMDSREILIRRSFKDKKFGWIESEITVKDKYLKKSLVVHTIIGLD